MSPITPPQIPWINSFRMKRPIQQNFDYFGILITLHYILHWGTNQDHLVRFTILLKFTIWVHVVRS